MRRIVGSLLAAMVLAAPAVAAEPRFAVVPATTLPSADVPNAPGSLALPPAWESQASQRTTLSFAQLQALWKQAGQAYGIPWEVLAAINKIETNFGQNMGPSSAGAVGWMQFMPGTWQRWGMDASGDRVADPWNPYDAVHAAARYLAAAGARTDLYRGVYAYNHADWYVQDVLDLAQTYARGGLDVSFGLENMQLSNAGAKVAGFMARIDAALARERQLAQKEKRLLARVASTRLLSDRLPLQKRAVLAGVRLGDAQAETARLRGELADAQAEADAIGNAAWTGPVAMAVISPGAGDEVFPVTGGPDLVSVGRDHHDYPAADIAAPWGTRLVAHAAGVIAAAWPTSNGNCGIGFQLRTHDERTWTYCHLAFLEPGVRQGVVLGAGFPVGAVGSTGHSTGPHLHLQLSPAVSYPQSEAWFQRFAGTAFRWQGEAAPALQVDARSAPHSVFAVLPSAGEDDEIQFTRSEFTR
jgi:murein DD-endopeptidase MepM/ murein hydrolase activator NlpD